mmetsp:Transcript_8843/g.54413  ORF Transcript_8843/g.54413 Transcript_8843/m.54413 type:complete len:86 (-) Transcript_8843:1998-2255(-)
MKWLAFSLSLIPVRYSGLNSKKNAPLLPVLVAPFALQMVNLRFAVEFIHRGRWYPPCIRRPNPCSSKHAKQLPTFTPLLGKQTSV